MFLLKILTINVLKNKKYKQKTLLYVECNTLNFSTEEILNNHEESVY